MRRLCVFVAVLCVASFPAFAQVGSVKEGVDGLRLALKSVGLLLSTGPLESGSSRISQVRVFNASTTPVHWDIRLDEVVVETTPEVLRFRLPSSFTVSVRLGLGAQPWVFDVSTEDAVVGLDRGGEGMFEGLFLSAGSLKAVSQPDALGVVVAMARGLVIRNMEMGSFGFEETWSWDDVGLRASVPQGNGRVLEVGIESVGVKRARRGERLGWMESLPWMAAIDRGMRVEENWSVDRLDMRASTLVGDRVDSDSVVLRDGVLDFKHVRDGVDLVLSGSDVVYENVRLGKGWGLKLPSLSLDMHLPTHPSPEAQRLFLRTSATGEVFGGGVLFPVSWDIVLEGAASLVRSVFVRTARSWEWRPVLTALDAVDVRLGRSEIMVDGQTLSMEGSVGLRPDGVSLDLGVTGVADGWPRAFAVWGGWPEATRILSSPYLSRVLSGPGPRRLSWGVGGLVVEGFSP